MAAVEAWLSLWNEMLPTKGSSVMAQNPKGTITEGLINTQGVLERAAPSVLLSWKIQVECVVE